MIKAVCFDVDGTLTDGHIYIGNNGEVMKAFYAHDAVGVRALVKNGVVPIIITGRESNIVRIRAREMNIEDVYTDVQDKKELLTKILDEKEISLEETAFMGDDLNDLEAMKICGFVACPEDAVEEVKELANFISKYKGGFGAVREFCDYILKEEK